MSNQPNVVMPIESALMTYCLLLAVHPIVQHIPRRVAAEQSFDALRMSRFIARHKVVIPMVNKHSTACVAGLCLILLKDEAKSQGILGRPMMSVPIGVPADSLLAADLIRRLMLGEQAGDALRNALDSTLGRPARHRAPLPNARVLKWTSALMAKLKRSLLAAGAL